MQRYLSNRAQQWNSWDVIQCPGRYIAKEVVVFVPFHCSVPLFLYGTQQRQLQKCISYFTDQFPVISGRSSISDILYYLDSLINPDLKGFVSFMLLMIFMKFQLLYFRNKIIIGKNYIFARSYNIQFQKKLLEYESWDKW